MSKIKNVLITGKPGSGKTTFILNLITQYQKLPLYGFYTKEIRENGIRVGFEIISIPQIKKGILAHKDIKSELKVGKYGVSKEALENIGVKAIEEGLLNHGVIIIDEIGKMELFSEKFIKILFDALNSDSKVIATIMEKPHPIADKIKMRKDTKLFRVNEISIEEILSILKCKT